MDDLEKKRAFWAKKEVEWEANREARKARYAEKEKAEIILPWDVLVMREMVEKGPGWFVTKNNFYESLKFGGGEPKPYSIP